MTSSLAGWDDDSGWDQPLLQPRIPEILPQNQPETPEILPQNVIKLPEIPVKVPEKSVNLPRIKPNRLEYAQNLIKPDSRTGNYTFEIPVVQGVPQVDHRVLEDLLGNFQTLKDNNTGLHPVLTSQITEELLDSRFVNMGHYAVHTYIGGKCRGPLCGLKMRHAQRALRMRKAFHAGTLKTYIEYSRQSGRSQRFTDEEINLNRFVMNMLLNQYRRVPLYLQMLVEDPLMHDVPRWERLLSIHGEPTRTKETLEDVLGPKTTGPGVTQAD